jgi:hypothetical protein
MFYEEAQADPPLVANVIALDRAVKDSLRIC